MSDNINVTPGTGATIAAESLSGALVQRIKMVLGNTDVDGGDVSSTNPMPITGSITATNLSIGATGAVVPVDATMVGGSDGTNLRAFSVSSAGVLNVNGSAFTQPISGSVTVTQATGSNLHVAVDSLPPTPAGSNTIGAVTQASGPWTMNLTQISGSALALGQSTMAGSIPVAIASNQSAIPVSQSGTWTTGRTWTLLSGTDSISSVQSGTWTTGRTWTLASGSDSVSAVQSGTWTVQPGNTANTTPWLASIAQGGNTAAVSAAGALKVDGSAVTQPVSGTVTANQGGSPWGVNLTQVGGAALALGQSTMAGSLPVAIASNQSAIPVSQNGVWTVQPGNTANTTPWLVTVSTALPAGSNLIGSVNQGTSPWVVGGTVAATQSGTWSAGRTWTLASGTDSVSSVQSGTWTVQPGNTANTTPWLVTVSTALPAGTNNIGSITNITGTISLPTGAATAANQTAVIGSATGGTAATSSQLIGGIYNSAPPALTTGQQAAIQLDSSGRILPSFYPTQSVSGTIAGNGNLLAQGSLNGYSGIVFEISGTWVSTLTCQGSNGIAYYPVDVINLSNPSAGPTQTITTNGLYYAPVNYLNMELVSSGYVSGTVTMVATLHVISPTIAGVATATDLDKSTSGTIAALNGTVVLPINGLSTVNISVTGTWVATITFEAQSGDGVWNALAAANPNGGDNVSTATVNETYTLGVGGFTQVRVRASAYTSGTIAITMNGSVGDQQTLAVDPNGNQQQVGDSAAGAADSGSNPIKIGGVYNSAVQTLSNGERGALQLDPRSFLITTPVDGFKQTYSAAILGLAVANTPTDIFTINGSATKTIRVTRIAFTAIQTTAAQRDVVIIKRSAANTGGTSSAVTAVPHDSSNAAGTASVKAYTVNPTGLGATVGNFRTRKVFVGTAAGTQNSDEFIVDFGDRPGQAIVLRGTAETLAINLNAVTSAGNSCDISIEWTEE